MYLCLMTVKEYVRGSTISLSHFDWSYTLVMTLLEGCAAQSDSICQTLRVFGRLMQIRVFMSCCVPLERSNISVRNLKVSVFIRDTPAPVSQNSASL
jgi:hypothetical protein